MKILTVKKKNWLSNGSPGCIIEWNNTESLPFRETKKKKKNYATRVLNETDAAYYNSPRWNNPPRRWMKGPRLRSAVIKTRFRSGYFNGFVSLRIIAYEKIVNFESAQKQHSAFPFTGGAIKPSHPQILNLLYEERFIRLRKKKIVSS